MWVHFAGLCKGLTCRRVNFFYSDFLTALNFNAEEVEEGGFLQLGGRGLHVCGQKGGRRFLPEQKGACLAAGKRRVFFSGKGA